MRRIVLLACLVVMSLVPATAAESQFQNAVPGRVFAFPRDHGKHPEFQTEWWYFTGNLDSENHQWGFQLTFFRRALVREPVRKDSSWAVRDIYPAHFALTDVTRGRFFHTDLLSREGPGLAGAGSEDLNVYVKNWTAVRDGETIHLKAQKDTYALELSLTPEKPPLLHGDRGFSRKGDSEKQASYYYSMTRLKVRGTITFDGQTRQVNGYAWMDHEFSSGILDENQVGWDWFSIQLDDGTELMAFHLRKKDGTFERPFGTFVPKQGEVASLESDSIIITPVETWVSPNTGTKYPSRWKLEIPGKKISLELTPLVHDQELVTGRSTAVTYWEGAVSAKGLSDGKAVTGRGYVELTGYAHSMAGRL
jgi:predicted secreted hydrolase